MHFALSYKKFVGRSIFALNVSCSTICNNLIFFVFVFVVVEKQYIICKR